MISLNTEKEEVSHAHDHVPAPGRVFPEHGD